VEPGLTLVSSAKPASSNAPVQPAPQEVRLPAEHADGETPPQPLAGGPPKATVDALDPARAPDPQSVMPPPVLTIDELAAYLRVNHKTVRDAIARGDIPGVRRIGGAIRIHRDTVLTWLSSGQGRVSGSRRSR